MLAIVAPGQGSQTPGFLSPWIEDPQLKSTLAELSESIGLDLVHLGTLADADEIRDTANAQPLIVSAGLLGMKSLGNINFSITAGHSVGEITSAAVAGVISELDAMRLVRERGQAMAVAAAQTPTGMSAVLGGDRDVVIAALAALGLVGANENGAGQIVAAGKLDALAALEANPPVGARVRPLAVAGAFHTEVMEPAVGKLQEFARGILVSDPRVAILSNREGAVVTTGREVLDRIVNQIANPVRWDLCMEAMKALGVTAVIELPPAGTLIGLIKRALPGVETLALKTPADLDAARDLIARQSVNS
ncbi:MAG: ACP S-malonyltransferase [Candidatus Nanopelagicaceae bacterium]|nr:ACP S-malonyltransferase [Candidatus Nanopelagicaceae bacterium]